MTNTPVLKYIRANTIRYGMIYGLSHDLRNKLQDARKKVPLERLKIRPVCPVRLLLILCQTNKSKVSTANMLLVHIKKICELLHSYSLLMIAFNGSR